jgi:pimeloyl-ACP methyl ester carboxylesterase
LANQPPTKQPSRRSPQPSSAGAPIAVSGRWLIGALAVVLMVAGLCAYGTLCLLFYQGQWQMMLHPSRSITVTPASQGIKFDDVRFDYTETGVAKLDGWWIPAEPASRWSASTVLYLHSGEGSLSDAVDDLIALHSLGINVFAFDYRGFGRSTGIRPGERRMAEDAGAAWRYLTDTRHLAAQSIVVYGSGVGASLATQLAVQQQPAGLVLDGPSETAGAIVHRDQRAKMLPLSWLLTERFDPADALQGSTLPKLFLDRNGAKPRTEQLYRAAALPKEYFELKQTGYESTLRRFFDEILR